MPQPFGQRFEKLVIQYNGTLSKIHITVPNSHPTKNPTMILLWVQFVICHRTWMYVSSRCIREIGLLKSEKYKTPKENFPCPQLFEFLGSTIRMLMCLYWSEPFRFSSRAKMNFFLHKVWFFSAPGRERGKSSAEELKNSFTARGLTEVY